jgi:hypothetical protein
MVYALGRIGLSEVEYIRMTLRQFLFKADAFNERIEDGWEQMRLVVALLYNVNSKKKISEQDVVRLARDRRRAVAKAKDYDRLREKAKKIREQRNGG